MKDRLYLYRPGFEDDGTVYFCPYCAQVIGFLTYYPAVRDTLEIVELAWPRPRQPLVEALGSEHQAAPILVLSGEPVTVPRVTTAVANGHHYIEKTLEILRYLAATRGVPSPH